MAEKQLVLDGVEVNYEGIFDVDQLLKSIDRYSSEKGYAKSEKERKEKVTASGRELYMELRHTKAKTPYFVLMIKMRLHVTNLKDIDVEVDGRKEKLNKGKVNIIFDGWTTSDFGERWTQKPFYYFLISLYERVGHKIKMDKYYGELISDCHYVRDNLKAFLDLHKFRNP